MLVGAKLVSIDIIYLVLIKILSEKDGDFWNDKTGINMTAQDIESWTLEGSYYCAYVSALC
jgi:hypothetical protein